VFTLSDTSPLRRKVKLKRYQDDRALIPLLIFYHSDYLLSRATLETLLPHGVTYNDSVPHTSLTTPIETDILKDLAPFLSDPSHNIRTIILNTGLHYNSLSLGGGVNLAAMQELYRSVISHLSSHLTALLRPDQRIFFRSSTWGHEQCNRQEPTQDLQRADFGEWNWHGMRTYNSLWKVYLDEMHVRRKLTNWLYLDVERPTMMREDAVSHLPLSSCDVLLTKCSIVIRKEEIVYIFAFLVMLYSNGVEFYGRNCIISIMSSHESRNSCDNSL